MHRPFAALALLGAVALSSSSCAGFVSAASALGQGVPPVSASGPQAAGLGLAAERVLASVKQAYISAGNAYRVANDAGQLPPAVKAQLKGALLLASKAIDAASTAYNLSQAASFGAQISDAQQLLRQVTSALPAPRS